MNRDAMQRLVEMAAELAPELDIDPPEMPEDMEFGMPEAAITTAIDVSGFIAQKRESITMHASQVTDSGFFLSMPVEMFARAFSTEWFIRKGAPPGIHEDKLAGL